MKKVLALVLCTVLIFSMFGGSAVFAYNTGLVELIPSKDMDNAVLLQATYDEGMITNVSQTRVNVQKDVPVVLRAPIGTRVFLWNSLDALEPLSESKEVTEGSRQALASDWSLISSSEGMSVEIVNNIGGKHEVYKLKTSAGKGGSTSSPVGGFVYDLASTCENFPSDYSSANGMLEVSFKFYSPSANRASSDVFIDLTTDGTNAPAGWGGGSKNDNAFGRINAWGNNNYYRIIGGNAGSTSGAPTTITVTPSNFVNTHLDNWVDVKIKVDLGTKKIFAVDMGQGEFTSSLINNTPTLNNGNLYLKFHSVADSSRDAIYYFADINAKYTEPAETYNVTEGTVTNGSLTFSPNPARAGQTVTIAATPNDGYALDTVSAPNGINFNADTKTFIMPAKDVSVNAVFRKLSTITIDTVANGSASITSPAAIDGKYMEGKEITLTASPDSGYMVTKVSYVNNEGQEVEIQEVEGSPGTYKFTMPAYDIIIKVETDEIPSTAYNISYSIDGESTSDDAVVTDVSGGARPATAVGFSEVQFKVDVTNRYRYLDSVKVLDAESNDISSEVVLKKEGDVWSFIMPVKDVTIAVTTAYGMILTNVNPPFDSTQRNGVAPAPNAIKWQSGTTLETGANLTSAEFEFDWTCNITAADNYVTWIIEYEGNQKAYLGFRYKSNHTIDYDSFGMAIGDNDSGNPRDYHNANRNSGMTVYGENKNTGYDSSALRRALNVGTTIPIYYEDFTNKVKITLKPVESGIEWTLSINGNSCGSGVFSNEYYDNTKKIIAFKQMHEKNEFKTRITSMRIINLDPQE